MDEHNEKMQLTICNGKLEKVENHDIMTVLKEYTNLIRQARAILDHASMQEVASEHLSSAIVYAKSAEKNMEDSLYWVREAVNSLPDTK